MDTPTPPPEADLAASLARVKSALAADVPLDIALASEPEELTEALRAELKKNPPESEAEFHAAYAELLKKNNLTHSTPEAAALRTALAEKQQQLESQGIEKPYALSYAAGLLSLKENYLAASVLTPSLPPVHQKELPTEITKDNIDSLTIEDLERIRMLKRKQWK